MYISGNAVVILSDPATILQTIYDDDSSDLTAVAIDEASGKIAACTKRSVRIYRPYGQDGGALKVWCIEFQQEIQVTDQTSGRSMAQ